MSTYIITTSPRDFLSQPRQIIRGCLFDTIEYPPLPCNDLKTITECLKEIIPSRNFAIHTGIQKKLFIEIFHESLELFSYTHETPIHQTPEANRSSSLSVALNSLPRAQIVMDSSNYLSGVYPASNEMGWERVPAELARTLDTFPKTPMQKGQVLNHV
jgi:hypothetical protein